jgi:Flp pilus assembly pilin Flp
MRNLVKSVAQALGRLGDERGGEVIEYALILGIIIVVVIATIGSFGTHVSARWTSVNSSM